MSRISTHIRSNVVGYVALFLALSGTAYALQENSVKSKHIVNGEVKAADLDGGAVSGAKVADGSLDAADVADTNSLAGSEIDETRVNAGGDLAGPLASTRLGANTVTSGNVIDDGVKGADVDESTLSGIGPGILGATWDNLSLAGDVSTRPPAGYSAEGVYAPWVAPVPLRISDLTVACCGLLGGPGPGGRTFEIVVANTNETIVGSIGCTVTGNQRSCGSGSASVSVPAGYRFYGREEAGDSQLTNNRIAYIGFRVRTP